MDKKIIFGISSVALLVLVGFGFLLYSDSGTSEVEVNNENESENSQVDRSEDSNDQDNDESSSSLDEGENDNMDESISNTTAGVYEEYSEDKIKNAANGDVVLFFHASWCSTCRLADKNIKEDADEIPSDLTILKVDYDSSTELRQKYGVTTQHTFVKVDENGNEIRQMSSLSSVSSIADFAKDE